MGYIGNTPADKYQTLQKQSFTTSATTSYTLSYSVTNPQEIALFINNVRQNPNSSYTVSGTTLTLSSATASTDVMYAVFLGKSVGTIGVPAGGVGTSQIINGSVTSEKLAEGAGGISWQTVKTSDFTAEAGKAYWVNTTSGAISATLPSSPSLGDTIIFGDYASTFQTNSLTILLNGEKLDGSTNSAIIATQGTVVTLVYIDSTKGWLPSVKGSVTEYGQATFIAATGGTITTDGDYKFHQFTTSGTFAVQSLGNASGGGSTIEYLIVGGGGSGGTGSVGVGAQSNGAGGGAGGIQNNTSFTAAVQSYSLVVGAGGAGVNPQNAGGNDGNNSTGFGATAGLGNNNSGMTGGASGTPQSKSGGGSSSYAAGGGGGAGANGSGASGNNVANGGAGLQYSNFSTFGAEAQSGSFSANPTANGFFAGGGQGGGAGGAQYRAAGGGGAAVGNDTTSAGFNAGVVNTGGGGAGGYAENAKSGNGGSGVVIVRYKFQ